MEILRYYMGQECGATPMETGAGGENGGGPHAHNAQTSLIQAEAGGDKAEFSLLLCHAQDHFMTTMTLKDVAIEIIDIYTRL